MRQLHRNAPLWLCTTLLAWAVAGSAAAAQPGSGPDIDRGDATDRSRVVQSPRLDGADADNSCAAQWRRYNAAYACLNPYRIKEGRVRAEGFAHCPVLTQPDCPPPDAQ